MIYKLKKRIEKNYYYIICFFIIVVLHFLMSMNFKGLVQSIGNDEAVTLSWTSFLSGVDWSDVVELNKYYGFGFTTFLGILNKFTTNPLVLYQLYQAIVAIMYATCGIISLKILCKLLDCKPNVYCLLTAISSVFVPIKFVYVFNEHMYILINWLIVFNIIRIIYEQNERKIMIYFLENILILGYSLTVHDKSLTMWCAFFLAIILFLLKEKNEVIIKTFIINLLAGMGIYKILQIFIKMIRKGIWDINSKIMLNNTTTGTFSTLRRKILYLKNPINYIFPILTIISQLFFMSMVTGGIFLIFLLYSLSFIFKYYCKKCSNNNKNKAIFIISVYVLITISITIVMQSLTWMPDATKLDSNVYWLEILGKRAKLYLRYFCCYCGPAIVLFAVYLKDKRNESLKYFKLSIFLYAVIALCVILFISKWYNEYTLISSPTYSMFIPFVWFFKYEYLTRKVFVISIFMMYIFLCFLYFLFKYKKDSLIMLLVLILFLYQYFCTGLLVYKSSSEKIYSNNYPVYQYLKIKNIDNKVIYCPNMNKSYIQLKFYLTEYELLKDSKIDNEHIIIFKLDEEIQNNLIKQGYIFEELGDYRVYIPPKYQ